MAIGDFPASAPGFEAGPGAVDCHIHIVGAEPDYPFAARRSYAVPPASISDYQNVAATLGIDHAVVIQPSFYGTDNRCLVDTLGALGGSWRGVAVIDLAASDGELDALAAAGARGTRINLVSGGAPADSEVRNLVEAMLSKIKGTGWHLQVFTTPDRLAMLAGIQASDRGTIVIDHFGLVDLSRPDLLSEAGEVAHLRRHCEAGGYVKLSGLYRVAEDPVDPRLADVARALFEAAPDRVVWGSDWPHTPKHSGTPTAGAAPQPYRGLDTGRLLAPVASWFPDERDRHRLLVANPKRLYDL